MRRDKLVMLQWSQSSEIMGGYSTPDSMLDVYHEIISVYCALLPGYIVIHSHHTQSRLYSLR